MSSPFSFDVFPSANSIIQLNPIARNLVTRRNAIPPPDDDCSLRVAARYESLCTRSRRFPVKLKTQRCQAKDKQIVLVFFVIARNLDPVSLYGGVPPIITKNSRDIN